MSNWNYSLIADGLIHEWVKLEMAAAKFASKGYSWHTPTPTIQKLLVVPNYPCLWTPIREGSAIAIGYYFTFVSVNSKHYLVAFDDFKNLLL